MLTYLDSFASTSTTTVTSPDAGTANPITLTFSRNSVRNATYDCDSANIHYRISTPSDGLTSVYRWDKSTNDDILVAEWEHNKRAGDRVKLLTRADMPKDFQPVKGIIQSSYHFPFDKNRSFIGENGRKYTWTYKGSYAVRLYPADGEGASNRYPIAEYHPPNYVFNKRNAYVQLQPEALEILDTLILTYLYVEKERRDKTRGVGVGVGGGVGGGF